MEYATAAQKYHTRPYSASAASLNASCPSAANEIAPSTPDKIKIMFRFMACCILNLTSFLNCLRTDRQAKGADQRRELHRWQPSTIACG